MSFRGPQALRDNLPNYQIGCPPFLSTETLSEPYLGLISEGVPPPPGYLNTTWILPGDYLSMSLILSQGAMPFWGVSGVSQAYRAFS